MVDEAYIEFSGDRSLRRAHAVSEPVVAHPSKAYGRCPRGLADAAPEIVALLGKVIPPYSIPQLTISTRHWGRSTRQRERVAQVRAERERLSAALPSASPCKIWPSVANFLLVDFAAPEAVLDAAQAASSIRMRNAAVVTYYRGRHQQGDRSSGAWHSKTRVLLSTATAPSSEAAVNGGLHRKVTSCGCVCRPAPSARGYKLAMVTNQDGLAARPFRRPSTCRISS